MVEKDVFLNIRSDYNGEEVLKLLCDGKFSEKDGGYVIKWDSCEFLGEEDKENSVEVYGEDIFICHLGKETDGELVLENGKTCAVSEFDAGAMQKIPVQFFITEFKNSLSEKGGSVVLSYSVSNPYTSVVSKRLEISVL